MTLSLRERIETAVVEDPQSGVFRCRRDIFTDPELFELEIKHIFEGNWVYLAHESQVAGTNDWISTWVGRVPVFITRRKDGELNAFVNSCSHRGAQLCRRKRGTQKIFVCPFHGWSFTNDGKLLKAKDESTGAYPDSFDTEGSHDLTRLARFASYRGFLFGSLSDDVQSLEDYLGETRVIIDQIVDQAPEGIEVLKGNSTYTFDGNWKLQMENGCDGYHVSSVHYNYAQTMGNRAREAEKMQGQGFTKAVDAAGWSKSRAGVYGFENGHIMLWTDVLNPEVRPVWEQRQALEERVGKDRAGFMVSQSRNLALYPNVFLMDQFSTQIRVVRPISVGQSEVTIYCFAPKGESAELRATRIRQYEDFFNVSGMGTPDDLEEFRTCQAAYEGAGTLWNDLSRGAKRWIDGADDNARAMGMKPKLSSERSEDEGLFVRQHEFWAETILAALDRETAATLEAAA